MNAMAQVFIGMGSNLGDRMRYLQKAFEELLQSSRIIVKRCSSIYETEPVGAEDQPLFLNVTVELDSPLQPRELLRRLKEIEYRLGRTKSEHWGPREIDLDILYYGNEIFRDGTLCLPHPEIINRRFVLIPMKEIAAKFLDPQQCLSIEDLLQRCSDTRAVRKISPPFDLQVRV
jgi:2-amino-4-hydroxy-6-hydroxymethyldihydropteridine diphosphokinase